MKLYYVNRLMDCGIPPSTAYLIVDEFLREYRSSTEELEELIRSIEGERIVADV